MLINFELEKSEVRVLINALSHAASQANSLALRNKILAIISEIHLDIQVEDLIVHKTKQLLDPYTNANITEKSNLRNGLGIPSGWIDNFMYQGCNKILYQLISLYKPGNTATAITKAEAKKCLVVQDVVDLIKANYEKAS